MRRRITPTSRFYTFPAYEWLKLNSIQMKAILIGPIAHFSISYHSFKLHHSINQIFGICSQYLPTDFYFSHDFWIVLKCWLSALGCSDCWLWNMIDDHLLARTISNTKRLVQLSIMSGLTAKEVFYSRRHHSWVINAFFYAVRYRFTFIFLSKYKSVIN